MFLKFKNVIKVKENVIKVKEFVSIENNLFLVTFAIKSM